MGVTPVGLPLAIDPTQVRVPLPGKWTFSAESMVGNRVLGNVDVSGFYCVRRLSAFGHGNVTVNLPCGLDSETMLTLWGWRLWAFYDGEPYWCGVPTGLVDQDGSAHTQFTLIELPGYLTRRQWDRPDSLADYDRPVENGGPGGNFRQVEQMTIAEHIAAPVGEVGVPIDLEPGGGVIRDRRYEYLEGGSRGQLLINLAGVLGGLEFRTEYRMTVPANRPQARLRIAWPRVGSDAAGLGLTVPGSIVNYRYQMDSDELRTRTYAVGDLPENAHSDPGQPPPPRPVVIRDRPNPLLPRLDAVDDWPGTILISTLTNRADTAAANYAAGSQQFTGSPPESFPPITSYGPGDTVTVRATTPLIPEGIQFDARLEQIEVNAATGVATWQATFTQPPQAIRETIGGGLQRLEKLSSALFHSGGLRNV